MILSFHPCIDADVNLIVAGRAPGSEEETLIKRADAVILPQGVRQDLYDLSLNALDTRERLVTPYSSAP
jgi:ribosomal protein S6--L-glutamate ligase